MDGEAIRLVVEIEVEEGAEVVLRDVDRLWLGRRIFLRLQFFILLPLAQAGVVEVSAGEIVGKGFFECSFIAQKGQAGGDGIAVRHTHFTGDQPLYVGQQLC